MAFLKLVCKAAKLERLRRELEIEKLHAYKASRGKAVNLSCRQRYRHFWLDVGYSIKKWLRHVCFFPKHSCMYRTIYKMQRDDTCENFTLKSVIGFISGFFLTYIFFMFFVFILNFKLSTATIMCSFFGSILTLGLAFSYKVRCVVFLLLPQFFSKRGRQALMAYAFILAITGPAKNTLNNMSILSESLACGQEQLKAAVRQILEVIKKPFYAIRDAIKAVVKTVKVIVKKIKEMLLAIKRTVMALLNIIKSAFQFLTKIINVCNKEIGTPFERCQTVFENAIMECSAKLGPHFDWLCSITYLVKSVCYIVKILDLICVAVDFINDSVIGLVVRKVKIFIRHIRTMFYVRIKFSHSFHFETNQSKSMSEITTGIVTEIRHRTENILAVFDFMSCATSMFFLFIILRVLHYRYKFLTNERFDNRFITNYFREIDLRRAQMEKETILPLNHRERALYITVSSIRLIKSEKVKLSRAAVVLGMTTLKLSTHMMADYALYWVLTVIRYHARYQSTVKAPNIVGVHVDGDGFLANLLKSIVKAFQPFGVNMEIDTIPCLPDPIPPDYDRYVQIAILLILCWILTIFEPYGLRLRHSVMCYYHPTRARQRAVWLYNHIIRSRSSFLKYARRQLRRKVAGSRGITKITCREYLRANIQSPWLRFFLGSDYQDACLLCGEVFREGDTAKPIRCAKPGCPGIYCKQCFDDLQNLCTVCLEPIEYGDLSDISEEKDSSEEEKPAIKEKKKRKKRRKRCVISKCLKDDHDSDSDDETDTSTLLKDDSDTTDSDYTSGTTTDNSYSYQNSKDFSAELPRDSSYTFNDVEKQNIPDYVSWDTFQDKIDEEDTESSSTTIVSEELPSIQSEKSMKITNFEDIASKEIDEDMTAVESQPVFIKSDELPADFCGNLDKVQSKVTLDDQEKLINSIDASSLIQTFASNALSDEPESSFNLVEPLSDDSSIISELKVMSSKSSELSRIATDLQLVKAKEVPKENKKISLGRFLFKTGLQCVSPDITHRVPSGRSQRVGKYQKRAKKKEKKPTETSVQEPTVLLRVTEIEVEQEPQKSASSIKKTKPQHISFSSEEKTEKIIPNKLSSSRTFHQDVVEKLQKVLPESCDLKVNKRSPGSKEDAKRKKHKRNKRVCGEDFSEKDEDTSNLPKRRCRRKSRKNKLPSDKSRRSRCRLYKKTLRLCKEAYKRARERRKHKRRFRLAKHCFRPANIHDSCMTNYTSEKVINITKYTSSGSEEIKPKTVDTEVGSFDLRNQESYIFKVEMASTQTGPSTSHSSLISELQQKSPPKPNFLKPSRKLEFKENRNQLPLEPNISKHDLEIVQKPEATKKRVPLTDRSNQTFSSDVTYKSSESVVTSVTISSDSETTFIESWGRSPEESMRVPTQMHRCLTCLKNFQVQEPLESVDFDSGEFQYQRPKRSTAHHCENCMYLKESQAIPSYRKKCFYVDKKRMRFKVPPLNLNFDSPRPRPVDHFKDKVKYEIVRETPRSSTSCSRSPTCTPRSPLNVNYQVYVPRFDKFVACSSVCKRVDVPQQTDVSKRIDDLRHIQRTKRLQHLFRVKREQDDEYSRDTLTQENVEPNLTASLNRHSVTFKEGLKRSYGKIPSYQEAHKKKVKDYYKKINNKQSTDNLSVITGDQNKFMKFIKGIFRKAKGEAVSVFPETKSYLEACNKTVTTSSPKFSEDISCPDDYTYTISLSSSSSGDKYLPKNSSETSTRSSGLSLMGSTVSHTRGGGNSQIYDSQQSFTTTRTTTSLPSVAACNVNKQRKKHAKHNSSDSELSDIEIYFGNRKPVKLPVKQPVKKPKAHVRINESPTQQSSTDSANTPMTSSKNLEEPTPRYSRQPAERDQDPDTSTKEVRLMKRFYSSPAIQNYTNVYTSTTKSMHDNFTNITNDLNPSYVDNIKPPQPSLEPERYFNMDMLNENYVDPNHVDCHQSCCCHGSARSKRSSMHRSHDDCKVRCSSEERHPASVRFSSRTEMHIPHEYDGPYRSPSKSGCYYQHTNKVEEIRDCLPEYSAGEPNKDYKCDKTYPSNNTSSGDNDNYQHPHDFCTCNSFEISSTNASSRRIMDDEASYDSGCSGRSEFPDLVYQNTNQFMDLVNELGETLSQRNKARVRKTMREFEIMSSQNKNLEKPVFDSDSEERLQIQRRKCSPCPACSHCQKGRTCEHVPFNTRFTKISTKRGNRSRCTSLVSSPRHSQDSQGYVNRVVKYMDNNSQNTIPESPRFNKKNSTPRWEMNPRTGEWYKIYDGYYQYDDDAYSPSQMSPRRRQPCICERHSGRYSPRRNSIERQVYNTSPRSCRCSNCGCIREPMY